MSYVEPVFKRPPDLKIVDMCIFVDENFEKLVQQPNNRTLEDTIVKYLYWIIESLSRTHSFFTKQEDYNDFSLFLAGHIFSVMRNKLVDAGQVKRGKKVVPIKSCLNYIKNVLYPYKVQYQQSMYAGTLNRFAISNPEQLKDNFREEVRQQYRPDMETVINDVIDQLPKKVYYMLEHKCPYKTDPTMIKRIYLSCMLTFNENFTLKNKIKSGKNSSKEDALKAYNKTSNNIILWHLPSHMEGYIRFMLYKIKRIITNEICSWRNSKDLSDEIVDSILETAFMTYGQNQEEL